MGTFKSAAQVAAKFQRVSGDMQRLPEILVRKAGDIVAREIKQDTAHLRFPRAKPVHLTAKVEVTEGRNAKAVVRPTQRGLWTILEEGAGGHLVSSKYAGGSVKSRGRRFASGDAFGGGPRAVINIPGIGFRKYAVIPKTRPGAPGTWEGGIRSAFGPVREATGIEIAQIIERD